jgi:hypothetical protein
VLAIARFQEAKEKGIGMGIAAGTAKRASDLFISAGKIVNRIHPDYRTTFELKVTQSKKLAEQSADKAVNVCFEQVVSWEKIEIPDSKNYVKFDKSANDDFTKIPHMNEILRHIVPPEVRQMQTELKQQL